MRDVIASGMPKFNLCTEKRWFSSMCAVPYLNGITRKVSAINPNFSSTCSNYRINLETAERAFMLAFVLNVLLTIVVGQNT